MIHGIGYDETSVKSLKCFITKCRQYLKSDANIFWIALQTNQLADTALNVKDDFKVGIKEMEEELGKNGWVSPKLKSNMRNQINISNIDVNSFSRSKLQCSVDRLKAGTNIIGEIPILIKVKDKNTWYEKKDQILKHCITEMKKKDGKNIVVLYDYYRLFKEAGKTLARLINDQSVVEYPSNQGKQAGITNIKKFAEYDDHILVTQKQYFDGCEASNVIFLTWGYVGLRNSLLRGVENVFCVQVENNAKINGMKEDNRFF